MDGEKLEKVKQLKNGSQAVEFCSSKRFKSLFPQMNHGNVMLKFSATWCKPCLNLQSALENLDFSKWNLQLINVDIDKCRTIADDYGVPPIPVYILFKDGNQVYRQKGFHGQKDLEDKLDQFFSESNPFLKIQPKQEKKEVEVQPQPEYNLSKNIFIKTTTKNMFLN